MVGSGFGGRGGSVLGGGFAFESIFSSDSFFDFGTRLSLFTSASKRLTSGPFSSFFLTIKVPL